MRALAILLVVWQHTVSYANSIAPIDSSDINASAYFILSMLGSQGVSLFFVISGFLITGILMDTAKDSRCLRNFYIRRSLRIFPLYYLSFLLIIPAMLLLYEDFRFGGDVFYYLIYVQNWLWLFDPENFKAFGSERYSFFDHFWSLAVEEQFYLFWPFLFLFFLRRFSAEIVIKMMVAVIAVSVLLRYTLFFMGIVEQAYVWTPSRLDSLIAGALMVFILRQNQEYVDKMAEKAPLIIKTGCFFMIAAMFLAGDFMGFRPVLVVFVLPITTVLFFFMLAYCLAPENHGALKKMGAFNPFIQHTAKISYGLYIFHVPVMIIVAELLRPLELNFWLAHVIIFIAGTLFSYAMASVSYRYFEKPILSLKDKWAPNR